MSTLRIVMATAAGQWGVISTQQAMALGLAPSTFNGIARREGWRRLQRGVYALPGSQPGFRQDCQAALLSAGDHAVLCRRTAAHLLGVMAAPPVLELFLPESERAPGLRGVRVCRTRTLRPGDTALVGGLRVTTAARTAVDLAAVVQPEELRAFMIDAQQRRLMHLAQVERRVERIGPVRGIGTVRRLAAELRPEHCDSVLEARVRRLIAEAGLLPPHPRPYPFDLGHRTVHIDIAWPSRRLGVEVDGFAYHSSREDLERDHRRSNALTVAGWRLLRVGWHRVERDPEALIAELGAAIG